MRDPLLAPLAAIATGILVSRFVPFEIRELLTVIAALFILTVLGLWHKARAAAAAACLIALVFAGTLTDVAHRPGPRPELDVEGREPVILAGCVVEPSVFTQDREQFLLELEPGARVRVNLFLREGEQAPALNYGQRIELEARVRRPHNFVNPGNFDYVQYLARKNIFWTASAGAGAQVQVLPGSCGSAWQRVIFNIRSAALQRLERLYQGRPYETGMMEAILIGESSKLEKVWTEQFRSTGTFHALVISGTHVAVLAAVFLFLLRLCFLPQPAALFLTVIASWVYAMVTGWQAPVIRSAAGLTLFMVGGYFYRQRRIMNLLAAVALGFLLLDPEQMFEPSFQLSFLSVGFIAALAVPLLERTTGPLANALSDLPDTRRDVHLEPRVAQFRVEMRLVAEALRLLTRLPEKVSTLFVTVPTRVILYLIELVVISGVVQVGLALPMAAYFHRVSFSGLSANAIVVPLMGVVVPIGFLAVFTGWTLPARMAGWLLSASQAAVNWHARLEPNWRIPSPPVWLAISFSAALIAVALLTGAQRPRSRLGLGMALGAVGVLLGLLLWHPFHPAIEKNILELTAIDVGQGDSLFVSFPDGKRMLMDGGGIPTFGRKAKPGLDIGEDVVSPYLWSRSIRSIDVLALSHAHEDHIGGMAALLQNFRVKELWTGATPESPQWNVLREKANRNGAKITALVRGRFDYGGTQIEVLSPSPDYVPSSSPRNNDSLALRISFGKHSFLLSGDMERQVEAELISGNLITRTDVLKVAHHGSKTSSTAALLDAAHPTFALISAGFENSYGHPSAEVLERLSERHVSTLRTDLYGLISIRSDGRRFRVTTATWDGSAARLRSVF